MLGIDKEAVKKAVLAQLAENIKRLTAAAESTRKSATHEEAKAENDKDTRALEQSYLARGQAARVVEVEAAAKRIQFMEMRSFSEDDACGISALIAVEVDGEESDRLYFIVPSSGGTKIDFEGKTIQLITPASPIGKMLIGKELGDVFEVKSGVGVREYEIVALA